MGPVRHRNDPRVVDVLVEDGDHAGRLQDQRIVVVGAGTHRRAGIRPHHAPVAQAAVRVVIREPVAQVQAANRVLLSEVLSVRNAAGRGVDHERRAFVAGEFDAALVPELVVGQDAALGPRLIAGARGARLRVKQVTIQSRALRGLPGRGFLVAQGILVGQRQGTFQGGEGAERENSGDIRVPLGRAHRGRGVRGLGHRGGWRHGERGGSHDGGRQASHGHLWSPVVSRLSRYLHTHGVPTHRGGSGRSSSFSLPILLLVARRFNVRHAEAQRRVASPDVDQIVDVDAGRLQYHGVRTVLFMS